jgi:hypothetical protein
VLYVALTLRAIARATRDILARDADPARADVAAARKAAAISDFAIHLDRSAEVDLRTPAAADAPPDVGDELPPDDEPRGAAPGGRSELFGEVNDLLTRIPSARSR